ncbi:phospholipid-transporting ATPase 1 [Olea europaea subsp. europaea]|uniref:Phospholipid-transporting ATPase n=1 Tax=Olea europaea subsp. europaea TaxID=158383 RepID=A0A8S0PHH6_OLEEU|nr:phospholipid-transporting ATPase 1 [Olea europaea subsp. europaea]
MSQQRPLVIPSQRTPGKEELPYTPVLLKSISENSKTFSRMHSNSNSQFENENSPLPDFIRNTSSQRSTSSIQSIYSKASSGHSPLPEFIRSTSSQRSTSSIQSIHSKASSGHSVREVSFELGSKPSVRHGSMGADSERFGSSYKEINDQDARLVYPNDPEKTNEKFEFARNSIRTGKYSILTFLPRNLFEQFHRVAYIYFLAIAILNQVPQLAVFGREASILPLAFVLLVTAVKDAYEDYRRHRSDNIENNRLGWVLVNDQFQQKKWKDIRVGEIIKVSANETLPCDMVLLSTSDTTGVAYIQTTNLDGESNLKTRYAKQETQMKNPEKEKITGLIKCEKPNRNIYGFQANMEIDGKRVSLGPSNIILRGCELRNTNWALGIAVYAGRETKAMLNNSGAPSKRSRLETKMNREIIYLSIFLVVLCTIISVCHGVWLRRHKEDLIMIPISLYISMELVRVGQAYFMIRDNRMFDEATNSRFQCRALNINEDLGQIKYVFSDKTGTLTENKMEFQCASIGGVDYSGGKAVAEDEQTGYSTRVDGQVFKPKMRVKVDPELLSLSKQKHTDEGRHVRDFFVALATCNTIVPLTVETSDPDLKLIDYQGESPDEQALVYAAAAYGYMLIERTSGHIVIDIQGERQRFNVLGLHEFDSDRKRMSVILGCSDDTFKVFVKGADTTMFNVIDRSLNSNIVKATEDHLHSYSSNGLRTLVVGKRDLSASEFEQWQSSYEKASTAVMGRAALLRKVAYNIENSLSILGASAIEDKLQQGVPEAIESLRNAGIKVWVLTGDKQETAISIGYSSKLLTSKMTQIVVNNNSKESCKKGLEDALVMCKKLTNDSDTTRGNSGARTTEIALVIDGTSLVHILDTELEEKLFEVASKCTVVLCCRVAPLQKAGIVALMKKRANEMTLAIGDGANDVSMIQMADVGIGISGQEGRQAVMASDFAMGQFRFLVPLLLVHGHWNYQRMSYMILYNFYRNALLVLVLFWYALFTGFTLTTAITDWSSVLYSVIYTSLPTIVVGILDKDLSRTTLLRYPQLYGTGQRQESYNGKLFWVMIMDTLWQSVAAFFAPLLAYWESDIDGSSIGDLWIIAVVILVNLHLAMDIIRWYWITHAAVWGSIVATFICVMVIDALPFLPGYWAFFHVADTKLFWACLLGITIAALVPRFVVKIFIQYFRPDDIQISREAEKVENSRESRDAEIEMNPIFDPPRR